LAILNTIRSNIDGLIADQSGQFAIWLGVLVVPLTMGVSLALDTTNAHRKKINLEGALDAAVLAAVTDQSISDTQRQANAIAHFKTNYEFADKFVLTSETPNANRLTLTAEGGFPTTMGSILGVDKIDVAETSTAEVTREKIICVMALNPSGKRSFHITHGAIFESPTCAVQVNSTSSNAAVVEKGAKATAEDFCVTGGATGVFFPHVNTQCSQIEDPYKKMTAPLSGPCISGGKGKGKDTVEIGNNVTMSPGTYCSKVHIKGQDVTMEPGTYIIEDSQFFVMQGASITAKDVTIVLKGKKSWLMVHHGSQFDIKAPSNGPLAGMAIFQEGETIKKAQSKSRLMGGAGMNIIGTVYLPNQSLELKGGSSLENTSPATSYIAYDISVSKDSYLSARVDHERAGIPPILPRADEGARLVK